MLNGQSCFPESQGEKSNEPRILSCVLRCLGLALLACSTCIPAEGQCYVYVPTHKSNSVAVIDTSLDRVVPVVPVEVQPLAVAITPNGAFAYVTNSGWILAQTLCP